MSNSIIIRKEQPSDIAEIDGMIKGAFVDHPHSNQTEHLVVDALRADNELTVTLVAEHQGKVVGHIALSRITINNIFYQWFGLGPVTVLPEFQNQGVASQLIMAGLKEIVLLGASGCVVVGDIAFYKRFGFENAHPLTIDRVPKDFFQAMLFHGDWLVGKVAYHPAFDAFTKEPSKVL